MRVLVACEFSGVVREAFRRRGHDVWSCDLLPSLDNSPYHNIMDVRELLDVEQEWDLMIAHPPCTYLCNSGVRWLKTDPSRWDKLREARQLFLELRYAPIKHICIENPIPHRYAELPKYTQIVQPWMFGHEESKATCLWLDNLPNLIPTQIMEKRVGRVHSEPPGPDRWMRRSITYQGIADAMAEQWNNL